MEKITIEIPVQAGDKLYRTSRACKIEEGTVTEVVVKGEVGKSDYKALEGYPKMSDKIKVEFVVSFGYCDSFSYKASELGATIFRTPEEVIKHIVKEL